MASWRIVEQAAGGLIFAFVLLDVFLTVLYARIGSTGLSRLDAGILAVRVGRALRAVLLAIARHCRKRHGVMSFCGPLRARHQWLRRLRAAKLGGSHALRGRLLRRDVDHHARGDFAFNANNLAELAEKMGALREWRHFDPASYKALG